MYTPSLIEVPELQISLPLLNNPNMRFFGNMIGLYEDESFVKFLKLKGGKMETLEEKEDCDFFFFKFEGYILQYNFSQNILAIYDKEWNEINFDTFQKCLEFDGFEEIDSVSFCDSNSFVLRYINSRKILINLEEKTIESFKSEYPLEIFYDSDYRLIFSWKRKEVEMENLKTGENFTIVPPYCYSCVQSVDFYKGMLMTKECGRHKGLIFHFYKIN